MNINYRRQFQFELFPGSSRNSHQTGKSSRVTKGLTLSPENIIVLCIIFIMTLVLFFSFGVEKGKRVALPSDAQSKTDAIRAEEAAVTEQPHSVMQAQQKEEERAVLPVDIPENLLDASESAFRPPFEGISGQEKLFTIQVASFKLEENARREADRLKGIGHGDAFVVPKGSYSIVCVGKFMQRDEAKEFSRRLKDRYTDCLVRRL